MRAFLTGANGFVGGHLTRHLEAAGDAVDALPDGVDIGDTSVLLAALTAASPDVVYHLAGQANVALSWTEPAETMRVNALGTLALLEAVRELTVRPRVLLVSSAEVYGAGEGVALDEDAPLRPTNPYAASKVAAEFIGLQAYLGRGIDVVRARPFNHIGAGQAEAFVVSGLAKRIVAAERAGGGEIAVGNLAAARDFTDVRDVVRAYRLLAVEGEAGAVYNVSSGNAIAIATVLERLVALAAVPVEPRQDAALLRPVDVPLLVGDGTRLAKLTGWKPEIALDDTLVEVLQAWRARGD
ncbi:MAG TPA: GDP-mannose 4,6-dehydratase [Polyangiaceae bacterium]